MRVDDYWRPLYLLNKLPSRKRKRCRKSAISEDETIWLIFISMCHKSSKRSCDSREKRSFFKSFGAACNVWQVDMKMRDGTLFEEEHESKNMLISTMKDERGKNLWIEIKYWFLSMCGRWWWWKASLHALPKCIS